MRLVRAGVGALLLVACASPAVRWEKPGTNQADLDRDRSACLGEASAAADASGAGGEMTGPGASGVGMREFQSCMEQRGWRRVTGDGSS